MNEAGFCHAFHLWRNLEITGSQNYRTVGVERDLWRSPSPTPPLKYVPSPRESLTSKLRKTLSNLFNNVCFPERPFTHKHCVHVCTDRKKSVNYLNAENLGSSHVFNCCALDTNGSGKTKMPFSSYVAL